MEKVVTINLNGNPYQLDESAFDAVRAYLEGAGKALADNPDRAEIIADLEQAIADKASAYLGPGRTVISQADMTRILSEMGPVEDDGDDADDAKPSAANAEGAHADAGDGASGDKRPRRIYRLPSGAMIAGVANGIAAYFQIDVGIVRLLFIAIAVLSHGWALIAYVVLMFVLPSAHTPEEWAAAHGAPFNAQEIIDRAKRDYDYAAQGGPYWSRYGWRAARRAQRAARRATRRAQRWGYYAGPTAYAAAPNVPPVRVSGVTSAVAGLIAFIFTMISVGLTIGFIVILVSLVATGAVLGLAPPAHLPLWAAILLVIFIFSVISGPVRAMRGMAYATMSGRSYHGLHAFDGLVWLGIAGLAVWMTYLYVPGTHAWFEQAQAQIQHSWTAFVASLPK